MTIDQTTTTDQTQWAKLREKSAMEIAEEVQVSLADLPEHVRRGPDTPVRKMKWTSRQKTTAVKKGDEYVPVADRVDRPPLTLPQSEYEALRRLKPDAPLLRKAVVVPDPPSGRPAVEPSGDQSGIARIPWEDTNFLFTATRAFMDSLGVSLSVMPPAFQDLLRRNLSRQIKLFVESPIGDRLEEFDRIMRETTGGVWGPKPRANLLLAMVSAASLHSTLLFMLQSSPAMSEEPSFKPVDLTAGFPVVDQHSDPDEPDTEVVEPSSQAPEPPPRPRKKRRRRHPE